MERRQFEVDFELYRFDLWWAIVRAPDQFTGSRDVVAFDDQHRENRDDVDPDDCAQRLKHVADQRERIS